MKNKIYKSEILGAVHEMASGLRDTGLMPVKTMKELDELCLTPVQPLTPAEIKAIREQTRSSQAVFARHLNVSPVVVSQWERGERKPSGPSLKLLTIVKNKGLETIA